MRVTLYLAAWDGKEDSARRATRLDMKKTNSVCDVVGVFSGHVHGVVRRLHILLRTTVPGVAGG